MTVREVFEEVNSGRGVVSALAICAALRRACRSAHHSSRARSSHAYRDGARQRSGWVPPAPRCLGTIAVRFKWNGRVPGMFVSPPRPVLNRCPKTPSPAPLSGVEVPSGY